MKVELPEELKIYNIGETWKKISDLLSKETTGSDERSIKADSLESFDGAGLQLLYLLHREETGGKSGLKLEGLSESINSRLREYGFFSTLTNTGEQE